MQVEVPPSTLIPIRNRQLGPTVFKDDATNTVVRWEGAADPRGEDVQWVPVTLLNHPWFATYVRRGILAQVDEQEAADASHTQTVASASAEAGYTTQAESYLHRPEVNDIVSHACVGPGTRAGATCPTQVPVRQSDAGIRPPLCDVHQSLAGEYVSVDQADPTTGLTTPTWVRASMGPRVTQAQQAGQPANTP